MNTKVKKEIVWGVIIASLALVLNASHYLFGGLHALAAGPHGHTPREIRPHGGFVPHQMMDNYHHGFSWLCFLLFLILGITVMVLIIKSLRRKAKASALQQFIDTSLISSHKPTSTLNSYILDQWEKNFLS